MLQLKLSARAHAYFFNAHDTLEPVMEKLKALRVTLVVCKNSSEPLDAIVTFFDEVSKWHDSGLGHNIYAKFENANYGQLDAALKDLLNLVVYFRTAGREEFGWNRTKRGEKVTADRVYLGDIYGLFTKTAAYWKTTKGHNDVGSWRGSVWERELDGMTTYDVIARQARNFMQSHADPMVKMIDRLAAL